MPRAQAQIAALGPFLLNPSMVAVGRKGASRAGTARRASCEGAGRAGAAGRSGRSDAAGGAGAAAGSGGAGTTIMSRHLLLAMGYYMDW